ncbi:hypothetical protein AB0O91_24135 [Kitasatospora sp. NPDC089797]|uniref:hypothetical protein n=1 Tax=Kitasatospora sp. NPDC089797 TaxID=3155298 RepID=UPI00341B7AFA
MSTDDIPAPGPEFEPTHAWLITLQRPTGSGFAVATRSGTSTFPPGFPRPDAYAGIREWLERREPQLGGADVLFFSLEPYRL